MGRYGESDGVDGTGKIRKKKKKLDEKPRKCVSSGLLRDKEQGIRYANYT